MTGYIRASLAPLLAFVLVGAATPNGAYAQGSRMLDHDAYEEWVTLGGQEISADGRWVLYERLIYDRDGSLVVRAVAGDEMHVFDRGSRARFDEGSGHVVFMLEPARDSVLEARRERRRSDLMPRDTLAILDLESGAVTRISDVTSFRMPDRSGGWLAYQLVRSPAGTQPGDEAAAEATPAADEENDTSSRDKDPGTPLAESRFEDVTAYIFAADGRRLAYATSTADGSGDGVFVLDLDTGAIATVLGGEGEYERLTFDEAGEQIAFLSNRDSWGDEEATHTLYHWEPRFSEARAVATMGSAGLPFRWEVSGNGNISFSENGRRLFFGTAPRPEPEVDDGLLPEERVRLDIWHWQDPDIQTVQLQQLSQERRRTYLAVAHLRENRVVQLADENLPAVTVGSRGDADLATGSTSAPYSIESSWESPNFSDVYLVDVRDGQRTRIRERTQAGVSLSPGARFLVWYDLVEQDWLAMDARTRAVVNLTAALPYPTHNEDHDQPSLPRAYGTAGWLANDASFLIYDLYDIWALDPTGRAAPRSVTDGAGRRDGLRFRLVRLDRDDPYIPTDEPLLLSAFDPRTKAAGFYRVDVRGGAPERLVMEDYSFSTPRRANAADVLLFTRESFTDFPDLWVSGPDFRDMRRITAENPQQAEYLWGTAELVEWTSLDGIPLQGILYKPDNFDPSRQYPMITYFYERLSDGLHTHYPLVPHRSRINMTFYTSRGYLVFLPDIVYRIGYPGESAMNSIMPGVTKLLDRGYVDRDNLGLQGHSWGGYQIAFMVTRTNMFKAGAPGAPVANMTSAYSGIRLESGVGRQFQYERTQSRLGGPLWEMPIRYIENSPLFWLDKVETPLLIMHNDLDGAVPWQQGIELFLGLRRLGKPAWLINYNGEPHWPTTNANKRDWNIRMQQFFDHYLLGAPAPVWMEHGIPAVEKGRTLGYEPASTDSDP